MTQTPIDVTIYLADQNPGRDRSFGITRMTSCLAQALAGTREVKFRQIVSRSSFKIDGLAQPAVMLPWKTDHTIGRLAADGFHPILCGNSKLSDLWYYPKGYLPRFAMPNAPKVITVHDTILQWYAERYPDYRSKADYSYWLSLMKRSIANADRILTVSKTAERQIREFADRFKIKHQCIDVTYEASDYETQEPLPESEKGNFIFHLASAAPHKKTTQILRWWKTLLGERADLPYLTLAGSVDAEAEELIGSCKNVRKLNYLEEDELVETLKRARGLILPSEVEGFGLPALEAYYCGTPVCFVADTSVDEILSPIIGLGRFSLKDRGSFNSALDEVLTMSHEKVAQIGNRLREKYSIRRFGNAVLDSFRDITGR